MILRFGIVFMIICASSYTNAQVNYCWFDYKPALQQDSVRLAEFSTIKIYNLKDTSLVKTIHLNECKISFLNEAFIKKSKHKKHKTIHIIEEKYTGNTFKLIHIFNADGQIKKTKNKLKKGDYSKDFAFNKIKYFYKDGLLVKLNFYLTEYKFNNKDFISIEFRYE